MTLRVSLAGPDGDPHTHAQPREILYCRYRSPCRPVLCCAPGLVLLDVVRTDARPGRTTIPRQGQQDEGPMRTEPITVLTVPKPAR